MNADAAAMLLARLIAEHGPGVFNDLALAAFQLDTIEEQRDGQDPTELVRDWCHDLSDQLESCL